MILDLHRQGLPMSAIVRRTGVDCKTVRKYIQAGLEPPHYGSRRPRPTLRERVTTYPDLSARRLLRELRGFGYVGGYSQLTEFLRDIARSGRTRGTLRERTRFLCRASLLIVDEIGYLPVGAGAGTLFFQLANARYERGAMILTSNRGFAEWGEVFGDQVVATALLDRLLHQAVVVQIEGASYRRRQHADLVPEAMRTRSIPPVAPLQPRRGRPLKDRSPDPTNG